MRCIEIDQNTDKIVQNQKINRNMRCIEIPNLKTSRKMLLWLIETWDVLKCATPISELYSHLGLIETWDVLKSKVS